MPGAPITILAEAEAAIAAGRLGLAEALCRRVIREAGGGELGGGGSSGLASAWNILGRATFAAGSPAQAAACFERARAADPYFKPAERNLKLARVEQAKRASGRPSEGVLIIREWGFGFWADVTSLLGGVILAEACGRTPVAHWGERSRFRSDRGGADAFTDYFQPLGPGLSPPAPDATVRSVVEALDRHEQVLEFAGYCEPSLAAAWLPRTHPWHDLPGREAVRAACAKYLRPSRALAERIDQLKQSAGDLSRTFAVHVRGTDKVQESPILPQVHAEILNAALGAMSGGPFDRVLLITDSELATRQYRSVFAEKLVTTPAMRHDGDDGLHYLPGVDGRRLGMEVASDAYLAAACGGFAGMAYSNVAAMVACLKDWPPGSCTLVGSTHIHDVFNPMPYAQVVTSRAGAAAQRAP